MNDSSPHRLVSSAALRCARLRSLLLGLLLGLVVPVLPAQAGFDAWTSNGPYGGEVTALAFDPVQPNIVYASSRHGGTFKSLDGGVTWFPANGCLSDPRGCGFDTILIDPDNPSTLYAARTSHVGHRVYRSIDGAATWSPILDTQTYLRSMAMDPCNPQTLYVGTETFFYKSIDGGESWVVLLPTSGTITAIAVDPTCSDIVYRSNHQGLVTKSLDAGTTWQGANTGLPTGFAWNHLVIDPQTPQTLYAAGYRGLYKSSNGGASWSGTALGSTSWTNDLVLDPADPQTLYIASPEGVLKSTDRGAIFSLFDAGLEPSSVLRLALEPGSTSSLLVGTYSGIFRSSDAGSTWSLSSEGFAATLVTQVVVAPGDPQTLYAGSDYSGVFKSTDGGISWSRVSEGLPNRRIFSLAVHPAAPQTLFAGSNQLFKSLDAGATWNPTGDFFAQTLEFDPTDPSTLFAAFGSSPNGTGVFKTTDGGETWQLSPFYPYDPIADIAVAPFDPQRVFAGIEGRGVYRSDDGGVTWTAASYGLTNLYISSVETHPTRPGAVYASTWSGGSSHPGGTFYSADSGNSWDRLLGISNFVHDLALDPTRPDAIFGGASYGFVYSLDHGETWTVFNRGIPEYLSPTAMTLTVVPGDPPTIHTGRPGGVFSLTQGVDLSLTLTESADPAPAGGPNLIYEVGLENLGPSTATDAEVTVDLTLPAGVTVQSVSPSAGSYTGGSWMLPTLSSTASATLAVELVVDVTTVPGADVIEAQAAVAAVAEPLFNPGDDSAQESTSVGPPPTDLTYLETHYDGTAGVDGLDFANHVAVSPDGDHVYVAAMNDNALAVFQRNRATGLLSFVEVVRDGVNGVDGLDFATSVTVSSDGNYLYATSSAVDNAVSVFARDPATGTLTVLEAHYDGVGGVDGLAGAWHSALSPDGTSFYVAGQFDHKVAHFQRDSGTGLLNFQGVVADGVGGVDGLLYVTSVAVDPTGSHLYASGSVDDKIAVFERHPTTGTLLFVEALEDGSGGVDGLEGVTSVVVSRDEKHLYAAGSGEDAVTLFNRDPVAGTLTFVEALRNLVDGPTALDYPTTAALDPIGRYLFVPSLLGDSLTLWSRDRSSGELTFVEEHVDGVDGVDGLDSASAAAVSPDGRHVYVTGREDDAVTVFAVPSAVIFTDGFETGDATAWSTKVP